MPQLDELSPFLKNLVPLKFSDTAILDLPIDLFIERVQQNLIDAIPSDRPTWDLNNFPLMPGQAMYILNYNEAKVTYQRQIEQLLGYSESEFTPELITNFFHPDQKEFLQRIIKGAITFGLSQQPNNENPRWMLLVYKARKKDGTYIPILRQSSIYQLDIYGRMISGFSILSDLSGMNNADKVEWKLKGNPDDEEVFRGYVLEALSNFFSQREIEILKMLKEGISSEKIASQLFISKNTVNTHRRNMLKKASCSSTLELIHFASKNGAI